MSDTPEETIETFAMDVVEYPAEAGRVTLRQVALGMYPAVVLTPARDEGDNLRIELSHISMDEAALLLSIISKALSDNIPTEPTDGNQP